MGFSYHLMVPKHCETHIATLCTYYLDGTDLVLPSSSEGGQHGGWQYWFEVLDDTSLTPPSLTWVMCCQTKESKPLWPLVVQLKFGSEHSAMQFHLSLSRINQNTTISACLSALPLWHVSNPTDCGWHHILHDCFETAWLKVVSILLFHHSVLQ